MSALLLELAERVEAASGPDRELSRAIANTRGWTPVPNPTNAGGLMGRWYDPDGKMTDHYGHPDFTASLDAAMTLVPEGASLQVTRGMDADRTSFASVTLAGDDPALEPCDSSAFAATPALALCAAALRALSAQEGKNNG